MDTYSGHVRTPADAIKLFEACRLGLLPRVQRRLSEKERQSIKSGSVFVWDEREAGMRRWTDGKSWSASRVSGSFLTYREMEGKRGGGQFAPPPAQRLAGKTPDSGRGSDEDQDMEGEGPDGYRYKPDGLMKQSFSITTSAGQHLHLISYYSRPHPNAPDLLQPTNDPALRHIIPPKGMYPESTVNDAPGPAVTRMPMQQGSYTQSPHSQHLPGPPQNSRGPSPYPYQISPGYNWPPSPASTPPFAGHYSQPAYPSAHPPLPPPSMGGAVHHSPYQHHLPQGSPYQQHRPIPQGPQPTFDRARPDSSLPPTPGPPVLRGMSSATAAQPGNMPMYPPHRGSNAGHGSIQAQQEAEQHAAHVACRALQSPLLIDPRISNHGAPALPNVQLNGSSARTTTPPQQQLSGSSMNGTSPTSAYPLLTTPRDKSGAQGQVIPSISSLVNAQESEHAISDRNGRVGSKSPTENRDQRPKDIPHDKLHILGEDQRAIRVLDRKFAF